MKQPLKKLVRVWLIFAIVFLISACGSKTYQVDSASDRHAMSLDIKNALTVGDCSTAISLSTQLYQSAYSNNDIRMLFASAHACNVGIKLYDLIANFSKLSFNSSDSIFTSLVQLFPSSAASDSRLQSSWYAMDALQAILNTGAAVAPADLTYSGSYNPGSIKYEDRTDDANTYLLFISMASIGTSLNRNGFSANQVPSQYGYHKTLSLPWITQAAVQADMTYTACSLAAGMYNLFDSISATGQIVSSNLSSALNQVSSILQSGMNLAALTNCLTAYPGMTAQCNAAIDRLKFRGACLEQGAAAAAASGVIEVINAGWL